MFTFMLSYPATLTGREVFPSTSTILIYSAVMSPPRFDEKTSLLPSFDHRCQESMTPSVFRGSLFGAKRLPLNTEGVMDSWHRWSKDGSKLVFSSKRGGDMTALYMSIVDVDGNTSRPVKVAGYDSIKVNIPEFTPYFQSDEKSVVRDTMDKIYIESK